MPGLPVAFAPLARNDIISIGRHIAEDNEAAANRFRIALTARCLKLGVSGRSHRLRPELGEGVRAVIVDKDNAPKWSPADLAGVTDGDIDAIFAPLANDWTPLD